MLDFSLVKHTRAPKASHNTMLDEINTMKSVEIKLQPTKS